MVKVLIKETDLMFLQGMEYYLSNFFWRLFRLKAEFITDYNSENIAVADVIVLSMCNGERYTCFPELRARRKGIIIGLVDERDNRRSPLCFEDILYLTRRESLEEITHQLYISWQKWIMSDVFPQYTSCLDCKHYTLSVKQRDILDKYYNGNSIDHIARMMNVSYKTVTTHKYSMMNKFGLKNDCELFRFLGRLKERSKTQEFM